ncbi:hypothetical protein D3C84_639980 [compost metagenome]
MVTLTSWSIAPVKTTVWIWFPSALKNLKIIVEASSSPREKLTSVAVSPLFKVSRASLKPPPHTPKPMEGVSSPSPVVLPASTMPRGHQTGLDDVESSHLKVNPPKSKEPLLFTSTGAKSSKSEDEVKNVRTCEELPA